MLTFFRVPNLTIEFLTGLTENPILILLMINAVLLLLGMIMDMAALILICTPIFLPIMNTLGIDPLQFGMILLVNLGLGLCTPPVGSCLFVGCAVGKLPMEKAVRTIWPFYLAIFVALMLITFVPAISPVDTINIQFTLFSAFYAPLIATISGGFLKEEGLSGQWSVAAAGTSALTALEDGSAHVVQSALSQGFSALSNDQQSNIRHFAQVNEMDGFFLTAKNPDPDFNWRKLEGAKVILFGGGQPLVMFKYAAMDAAFREGKADYVQQQGPFPQQLAADGVGHIVAQVGTQIGLCGFSSLAATTDWLATDMAKAFVRAYKKTRIYMNEESAAEIALAQQEYFPDIDSAVLTDCIATYQQLGNWSPHIEITDSAYDATLDIYQYAGGLKQRYAYNEVCCKPPAV